MTHGYHFRIAITPGFRSANEVIADHLTKAGFELADLRPDPLFLYPAYRVLHVAGTRWFAYSHGALRFDMSADAETTPTTSRTLLGGRAWEEVGFNFHFRLPQPLAEREIFADQAALVIRHRFFGIDGCRTGDDDPRAFGPVQLGDLNLPATMKALENLLQDARAVAPGYRASGLAWAPDAEVTCQSYAQCELRSKYLHVSIAIQPIY